MHIISQDQKEPFLCLQVNFYPIFWTYLSQKGICIIFIDPILNAL